MKVNLLIFLLFLTISLYGQTKHIHDNNGNQIFFSTVDTVLYFDFNENCSPNLKTFFFDTIANSIIKIDTIEDYRFRIIFSMNKKNELLSLFHSNSLIKSYSFEYLNQQYKKHWTSGEVIIIIKNELNLDSILIQQNIDFNQIKRDSIFTDYYTIFLPNNSDPFLISNQLHSTALFELVSPNFFYEINFLDYIDNPHYINQYYLDEYVEDFNIGIDVKNAWEISTGNPNLKIAVLDGGVILNHEDLVDNILPGHDATVEENTPDLHGGPSFGDDHGTEVAGVIVASNNNIGIIGIAHTSKVFPIRIGKPRIDNDMDSWYTQDSWIIAGLEAAISNDCSVINCSFHHDESIAINYTIDSVVSLARNGKGIPIVCSSGNNPNGEDPDSQNEPYLGHTVKYPAILEYTIAVGGIKQSSQIGVDFNFGQGLDLIAPATVIRTTSHEWTSNVNIYKDKNGTSFSAPMVTATIALMLSVNPNLTNTQIKEILFTSTTKLTCSYSESGYNTTELREYGTWNWTSGYGLLNTHAAVVNTFFYGKSVEGNNGLYLCDEAIYTISDLVIPEWVDQVFWSVSDNLQIIEKITPFSIKVKAIGIGKGTVTYNIVHNNYTKKIKQNVLINSIDNVSYNSYEFEGLQNITSNSIISGVNTVKPNCILTISSQILCTPNASIIVNPGGKLIINNGSLTNYCEDFPWQGIIIEGNSNFTQAGNNPNQGIFIMNNGVISNAKFGVRVGDELTNHNSGGIITFSNSSFINNRVSISMAPYNNIFNNGELMNRSSITNCNFLTNNDFFVDQTHFFCHVYLKGINGVIFSGCSFNSTMTIPQNTPFYVSFPKTGIRSINSRFIVKPTCNSTLFLGEVCDEANITHSSIFSGLNYGIVATSSGNFSNIEVKSTEFINNDYGIYISGVNNPKILKNRFEIGKSNNTITSSPVGIHIRNSTGFRIEENRFMKNDENNSEQVGLYVKNSGIDNNQVYKNYFDTVYIGQFLDGSNYSTLDSYYGLISLCNENSSNFQRDFIIGANPSERYNGINMYQSGLNYSGNVYLRKAAGNIFTPTTIVEMQYENLTGRMINYYFEPEVPLAEPSVYSGIITIPTFENSCPSKINGLNIQTIQSELTSITFNYGNLKYNYNQLIDAGNTPELIKLIQDEWSEDIWNLRTELLGQSPYLSQEAILSVAEENLLPPALLLEICIANPDATKDEGFLEKLRCCIPIPLPEYMIDLIKASWENKTLRTELEKQLSAFKTYRDEYQNFKTEFLLSDSIVDYSQIITHLETRGAYVDFLSLSEIAISQNDFQYATLYMDILENSIEKLTSEESTEVSSFKDYISIRESIYLSGKTIYNLDSIQIASLETYATSNNYRGAILTRNILCFLYDICIEDVPAPPKMLRIGSNGNNNQTTTPFIASVKVMPNPAHEYASFIWDMKSFDKNAILYIYDQNGKIIVTQPIDTKQGQWVWNIKNVPNGVYVYTLKSEQLILNSGKIIVNK